MTADIDSAAQNANLTPEPEAAPEVEASTGEQGEARPGTASGVRRAWPVALLAMAVLIAGAGLFSWWRAAHDDSLALGRSRDTVLAAATSHIETLDSLDYRHVSAGLAQWRAATTGTLHDQITQVGTDEQKLLADQQKISTGKVTDAAVLSLNTTAGTATVVATVEVTVRDELHPNDPATVKRNRFSANLVLVHGHWLVESLQQVAVNLS